MAEAITVKLNRELKDVEKGYAKDFIHLYNEGNKRVVLELTDCNGCKGYLYKDEILKLKDFINKHEDIVHISH